MYCRSIVILTTALLAGCADESIRAFQAKVDNNFHTAEIAVDPAVDPNARFSQLKFQALFHESTYGVAGHVAYDKSCKMLQIKGKFIGTDGGTVAAGIGAVTSYDKSEDRPFEMGPTERLSTSIGGAKLSKIVITGITCL